MSRGLKVGLALGGGAARALAHIGVIEGLLKHRVPVDVVTGTSMGAVIGAIYAFRPEVPYLKQRIEAYLGSEAFQESKFDFMVEKDLVDGEGLFFRFSQLARKSFFYTMSMTRRAFVSEEVADKNFGFLVDDVAIEELQLPFAAAALDLISGREVVLDRGSLRQAIAATCALPGILHPVRHDGRLLVDGGWIDAVPVAPARGLGADFVIGVDVSSEIREFEEPDNGLDTVFRADAITRYMLSEKLLENADYVLRPSVSKIHWADFSQAKEIIRRGAEEVDTQIEEIRKKLKARKIRRLFGMR
ncbi:hypothetical protein DESUT3_29390 [Desulfuromonas versatilis]|uniref:PNPLA domain-containing protein n=1 Tax=Desulfuromonas versatilis TaxID=2802975 RepID=A0ABN6E0I8_9BACT|nr:patatin-like phospholipase family protein [Desulfuromonas versatilis]BCR05870.1 hypothetical protein DESUT3_29390 [Desulfuromonas versatilis]